MPFVIVRDDITHVKADAIVNAANEQLRRGGGVCGAIFEAAGARRLQRACDKIGHCDTGDCVATPAFRLKARYIIHAVGPIWRGGSQNERELLASCYRSALELAASLGCTSIALPLISAGIYGFPQQEALGIAQEQIRAFIRDHEMQVTLVLYDTNVMRIADDLRMRVERYIDDVYVGAHAARQSRLGWELQQHPSFGDVDSLDASFTLAEEAFEGFVLPDASDAGLLGEASVAAEPQPTTYQTCPHCGHLLSAGVRFCPQCGYMLGDVEHPDHIPSSHQIAPTAAAPRRESYGAAPAQTGPVPSAAPMPTLGSPRTAARPGFSLRDSLKGLLGNLDAGFSETLLAMIDERGLRDAQVYKRANISRQHFSKMRSNPRYRPTKTTVLALAIALRLSLDDTKLLLERAGFALSHADQRDVIVEYFIREGIYDVFEINDALFAFDQPLLG